MAANIIYNSGCSCECYLIFRFILKTRHIPKPIFDNLMRLAIKYLNSYTKDKEWEAPHHISALAKHFQFFPVLAEMLCCCQFYSVRHL